MLFLSILSGPAFAQAPPVLEIKEPPIQWPRSHSFDMQHIKLELAFDWAQEKVLGTATLTLRPFVDGFKSFDLDATAFTVDEIKLANGKDNGKTLKYQVTSEKILIDCDRAYNANEELTVSIKYSVVPKAGLRFFKPNNDDPNRPYQIWSEGETTTNHCWFPCYDFPNDRATSEVIATVESKYRVISNGTLVSAKEDKEKQMTSYYWRMDKPYSSYLLSIIVGEFAEIKREAEGVPIYHYVQKDRVEDAMRGFARVPDMVSFYAKKLGQPYPFSKYAETTVFNYGGGMENITATTLTESALKDARALIDSDDGLSAHELAHQWFGDLVTCRDWSDLWLNESFANLMTIEWLKFSRGDEAYMRTHLSTHADVITRYLQGSHRPISTRRFFNADELFDENNYGRGQSVLVMLQHLLGEEAFWKAIHHYLSVNQNKMVTTGDFSKAIEESTGQNYDWFFDQWVYKMGQPELEVSYTYDDAQHQVKLRVKQLQKGDANRPWFEVPKAYRLPVDIAITTSSGTKTQQIVIDQADQEILLPSEAQPLIVNFDPGEYILKILRFTKSRTELMYQLRNDVSLTGRRRAAMDLRNTNDEAAITALIAALKDEPSAIVRLQVVDTLASVKSTVARAALADALNDKDWEVRNHAINELAALKDINNISKFQNIIEHDQCYANVRSAALGLGVLAVPNTIETLISLTNQTSSQDILLRSGLEALSYFKDARLTELALKYAQPAYKPGVRGAALYILGANSKGNAAAVSAALQALQSDNEQLILFAINTLSYWGDEASLNSLQEYTKRPNLPERAKSFAEEKIAQIKNGKGKDQGAMQ